MNKTKKQIIFFVIIFCVGTLAIYSIYFNYEVAQVSESHFQEMLNVFMPNNKSDFVIVTQKYDYIFVNHHYNVTIDFYDEIITDDLFRFKLDENKIHSLEWNFKER